MSNICQNCKQARATVHLTDIDPENSQPHEMHLCESCARESGATVPLFGPLLSTVATLASSALAGLPAKPDKDKAEKDKSDARRGAKKSVCPSCGMSYQEFRMKGRFGCSQCYDAFEEGLVSLLEKVHGSSQYVGEFPRGVPPTERAQAAVQQELVDLKRRLSRVIKNEDYEEAARVRDRIQELEGLLPENGERGEHA